MFHNFLKVIAMKTFEEFTVICSKLRELVGLNCGASA